MEMDKSEDKLAYMRLMFRVRHPDLEACWIEGYLAGKDDNWAESQNPYNAGGLAYEHWEQGYWAGFYGEQPLYDLERHGCNQSAYTQKAAVNEPFTQEGIKKHWTGKVVRIASAIAATVIAVELLDIAI